MNRRHPAVLKDISVSCKPWLMGRTLIIPINKNMINQTMKKGEKLDFLTKPIIKRKTKLGTNFIVCATSI
jgi:hypothetical protein